MSAKVATCLAVSSGALVSNRVNCMRNVLVDSVVTDGIGCQNSTTYQPELVAAINEVA